MVFYKVRDCGPRDRASNCRAYFVIAASLIMAVSAWCEARIGTRKFSLGKKGFPRRRTDLMAKFNKKRKRRWQNVASNLARARARARRLANNSPGTRAIN